MKKIFPVLLTATLLFACQNNKETYVLEGEAIGYADSTKIIVQTYSFKDGYALNKDTLYIKDGKFSRTYPVSKKPLMNMLRVDNERANIIYFPEDVDLKVTIDKSNIRKTFVIGGKQNASYNEYKKKELEFLDEAEAIKTDYQEAVKNNDSKHIALLQSKELNLKGNAADYRKEFIKTQPKSIFTTMVL